jgi:flagellar motor switch protein FliM
VTRFDVRLPDGTGGELSLCLPAPVMRYLRDGSDASIHRSPAEKDQDGLRMQQAVRHSTVQLSALIAETSMPLEQALTLSAGDVISIGPAAATPSAKLRLPGAADRAGVLVTLDGSRAIRITSPRRGEGHAS